MAIRWGKSRRENCSGNYLGRINNDGLASAKDEVSSIKLVLIRFFQGL